MNSDKLTKIAKILDENNHYALADKVDKIAKYYNPNAGETWYDRLGRVFSGNATIEDYPGLAANARFVETVKQRVREKNRRQNNFQNRDPYGIRNQSQQYQQYQQYPVQQRQQQGQPQQYPLAQQNQPQQYQNNILVSTTPQQFVQNLLQFGKDSKLPSLAQTMDMYANKGGTFNGQPINQNQQALRLYDQVKNYTGILSPQQILSMLTGAGQ